MKGEVVTADAMSCQKEIAKKIREKGANILSVEENQKGLYEDIRDYFEGMESGEIRVGARRSGEDGECGVEYEYPEEKLLLHRLRKMSLCGVSANQRFGAVS